MEFELRVGAHGLGSFETSHQKLFFHLPKEKFMKKSILLASLIAAAALVACGKKEAPAPAAAPAAPAPAAEASAPAADASAPAAPASDAASK
jgi:hypothetical protein